MDVPSAMTKSPFRASATASMTRARMPAQVQRLSGCRLCGEAVLRGQTGPGNARAQDVEDASNHAPVINLFHAARLLWQH